MKKRGSENSIAIIGLAFRFPGDLCDEQSFWKALSEGRDVIGKIGEDRWAVNELKHAKRSEPGKSITFSAGVLSRIDEFDASFFGISPREASWLDPQQRLLLELAWEAMENSGQVPDNLAGSDSAVFVGISSLDYGVRGVADLAAFSPHVMTGNTLSVAANRLSYIFDFRGPSMSVDTACSSSLVALHQACNALKQGETKMALVGGVNMLLHPYPFVGFTKASMISGGGKCRAFDAAADGYVRAEGGAVLLLKPLAQAEADGDPIHAVILASGINADGGQKTGITIPSSAGQTALMRSVLKHAKLTPGQIDYIEAHGTGTAVGDPVEAKAIGDVYGRGREVPLPIGSVKSNLGHLEAASGMAGLIKTIAMLKHRQLLPSINFHTPNPAIDFSGLNLKVMTECVPLEKEDDEPPVMGVNSFGFGGANAHVLLRGYVQVSASSIAGETPFPPLVLSARTPGALRDLAGLYSDLLNSPEPVSFYDIAWSAACRRQHLEHRLVVRGKDSDAIAALLSQYARNENPKQIIVDKALTSPALVAFVYSGNGAQYFGMGRRLLAEMPRFGELMAGLDTAMKDRAGFSVLEMLNASEAESRLDDTGVAQPLLFAMQVALTMLLHEKGIEPDAVAGHSTGEVAAAWASGALTLDQAITVICARSVAQAKARGGKMAAVGMSEQNIRKAIKEGKYETIEVAGINSPGNVTLAGSFEELDDFREGMEAKGVFFRILDLDYAFHSRSMDPIREDLMQRLGSLVAENSNIDFVSTVTGKVLKGKDLGAAYWWENVRQPVRFGKAIETLIARGCRRFVEIGPNAILQRYMTECLTAAQAVGLVLPSLRKKEDGADRLNETILRLKLCEPTPDFKAWFPVKGNFVSLPNYPWQREKFWIPRTNEFVPVIESHRVHPLLGWRLKDCEAAWENTLDTVEDSWLADHHVAGASVFPGAGYVEVALAAAREWFGGNCLELEELEILSPIVFDGEQGKSLRFELSPGDGTFSFSSRPRLSEDEWSLNAKGRLLVPGRTEPERGSLKEVEGDCIEADEHYRRASELGLAYGEAFQGFVSANVEADRITGRLRLPQAVEETEASYILHPSILDSCFQALINCFRAEIEAGIGTPYLPVKVGRLRFFGGAAPTAFEVKLRRRGLRSVLADISLFDDSGNVISLLQDCRFRAAFMQRKAGIAQWRIDAELVPHPADEAMADGLGNSDLKARVCAWLAENEEKLQRKKYFADGVPLFNALAVAFAYAAFNKNEAQNVGWIQNTLSLLDEQPFERRGLLLSLKRCLQDAALLKEINGKRTLEETDAPPPAEEIWRTLLAEFPDAMPELLAIGRVGRNLNALLGGMGGEELKLSFEKSPYAAALYGAPYYRGMNL
ncbi:MAG: type I polyketide synthase, partial [Alphaproteobacteria bacterium]|nr:type I polyketide synthase [Alphaproteobacteria bacterium]